MPIGGIYSMERAVEIIQGGRSRRSMQDVKDHILPHLQTLYQVTLEKERYEAEQKEWYNRQQYSANLQVTTADRMMRQENAFRIDPKRLQEQLALMETDEWTEIKDKQFNEDMELLEKAIQREATIMRSQNVGTGEVLRGQFLSIDGNAQQIRNDLNVSANSFGFRNIEDYMKAVEGKVYSKNDGNTYISVSDAERPDGMVEYRVIKIDGLYYYAEDNPFNDIGTLVDPSYFMDERNVATQIQNNIEREIALSGNVSSFWDLSNEEERRGSVLPTMEYDENKEYIVREHNRDWVVLSRSDFKNKLGNNKREAEAVRRAVSQNKHLGIYYIEEDAKEGLDRLRRGEDPRQPTQSSHRPTRPQASSGNTQPSTRAEIDKYFDRFKL